MGALHYPEKSREIGLLLKHANWHQLPVFAIRRVSKTTSAGAEAKLANNHAAADCAPATPPGLRSPAAFATSPATAAPIAMP
jgi:hypothetical protein